MTDSPPQQAISPASNAFLKALLADETTSRQYKLEAWLSYHRILKNALAVELGIHPSMISRIIKGDRAPKKRIEQLVAMGIPKELLPAPSRPPGRPKGPTNKNKDAKPEQQSP